MNSTFRKIICSLECVVGMDSHFSCKILSFSTHIRMLSCSRIHYTFYIIALLLLLLLLHIRISTHTHIYKYLSIWLSIWWQELKDILFFFCFKFSSNISKATQTHLIYCCWSTSQIQSDKTYCLLIIIDYNALEKSKIIEVNLTLTSHTVSASKD